MGGSFLRAVSGMILAGSVLAGVANGQATPSQNVVSSASENSGSNNDAAPLSNNSIQPIEETSEAAVDPASLLPDLPALRPAKASLIGGIIDKLDRVRDQVTLQIFGGGKMKIAFDTRTHIYNNGAPASASDLRRGDRIYVDTILDGSTDFAKNIRLKTATSGESQGVIVSYRADKGEMVVRDMLAPRPLKIRLTPQTRLIHGDHTAPASELAPGTLVAVKFGAQQDGSDVAREVSVLAVRGASFTFAGTVTAIDLRLGLLVLTSSIDHKTYEISIDPSVVPVDDSMRPGSDVTVLSRFDGSRYVARTVTVNSQNQR